MDIASLLLAALLGQTPAPPASVGGASPASKPKTAAAAGSPTAARSDKAKVPTGAIQPAQPAKTSQPSQPAAAALAQPSGGAPAQLGGIHDDAGADQGQKNAPAATAAQAPPQALAQPKAQAPDDTLAPVQTAQPRPGAAETLLDWLSSADQVALEGKPTPLADLLARLADRGQQTALVQTYWKLSAALAEYRIAADESSRLGQLLPPADATGKHPTDPLLESRLTSAEARLREAELAVVGLQYTLGELARLAATDPPVLPADLPHVGAYRTYFQERYARVSPPRGYLIDRSLPLLHRSLELRAMAAVAAADAADADQEAYHAGKLDALAVMESLAELTRQRRAFAAAVRDYNVDIAEYAFSVVPPGLSTAQLVSVLIGPAKPAGDESGEKAVAQDPPPVKRAGYDQPVEPTAGHSAAPGLLKQGPAAPIEASRPPEPGGSGSAQPGGLRRQPKRVKSHGPGSPRTLPSAKTNAGLARGALLSAYLREGGHSRQAGRPDRHVVAKFPLDDAGEKPPTQPAAADAGLYSALATLEPPQRLLQLADTLQWDRTTELTGVATSLTDALAAPGDRRSVIAAYWRARQRIAAYQIRQQQHDQLNALQAAALHQSSQPGGAEAMLRLQTARLAAEAGAVETQVAILTSQFELAVAMRRPLTGQWPLPTTPPHAGHFRLKLDTQPAAVVQSPPVRRLVRDIPTLYEALLRRAEAVVFAETARAEISSRCEAGEALLDPAIAITARTAEEALSLLADQTEYNVQFAEYVFAVAPPTIPAAELAGVLVVASAKG